MVGGEVPDLERCHASLSLAGIPERGSVSSSHGTMYADTRIPWTVGVG